MNVNRTTESVSFNTGISMAEYNESPVGQTQGQTQKPILPGSTTVSEALAGVFPKDETVTALVLLRLVAEGAAPAFRTAHGFRSAAERTAEALRRKGTDAANRAAEELERLLSDSELLDQYRSSLLES